jgi:hypothetical protein
MATSTKHVKKPKEAAATGSWDQQDINAYGMDVPWCCPEVSKAVFQQQ